MLRHLHKVNLTQFYFVRKGLANPLHTELDLLVVSAKSIV